MKDNCRPIANYSAWDSVVVFGGFTIIIGAIAFLLLAT